MRCYAAALLFLLFLHVNAADDDGSKLPVDDAKDWLRMKNGEMLSGSIVSLRNGTLLFKSGSYGQLAMPWSNVEELRSAGDVVVVDDDLNKHIGRLSLNGDQLDMLGADSSPDRGQLLSMVPRGKNWWSLWDGSLALGLSIKRGNTDQLDYQARFNALRRDALNRYTLSYLANISEVDDQETANNHRANARWDVFIDRRLFVFPLAYEFYKDRFQNIQYRHTPSAGLGYTVMQRDGLNWEVGGGLGYQLTRYDSVESGESRDDESAILDLGTSLKTRLTSRGRLGLKYNAQIGLSGDTGVNHHMLTTLDVDLIGNVDLSLSFLWDHTGKPQARSDGSRPEKDDYGFTAGLSYSF